MASISFTKEVSQSGSGETSWTFTNSDWSEQLKTLAYANITKCTLLVQGKGNIVSVNNHKMYVYIGDIEMGSNTDVDTSYETITNYNLVSNNSSSYINISGSSAGSFKNSLKIVANRGTLRKSSVKVTITWEYTHPTCTITLSPNGGTVSPTYVTRTAGQTFGTLPTPTREGYTFDYWVDADGRIYSTTIVTISQTVYARWTPLVYTITTSVSPEGIGTITGGGDYDYNTSATLTATTANTGYIFSHWIINNENMGNNNPISIKVYGNTTVIAVFRLISGTLNVDYQGGNWENKSFSVKYDPNGYESLLLSPPTKEGYTFIGWNFINNSDGSFVLVETENGLQTKYYYGLIDGATDTLTAIWELDEINKIYIGNNLIKEIYVGTNKIKEVYIGITKVYG